MTRGPDYLKLETYLQGARVSQLRQDAKDWREAKRILREVSRSLSQSRPTVRSLGGDSPTAQVIEERFKESAESMRQRALLVADAEQALNDVADKIEEVKLKVGKMDDLGDKPPEFEEPTYPAGVQPTPEQITAAANDRTKANDARSAWQTQFDDQEALARELMQKLDTAFIEAIPPMKAIHGLPDPTEPPPPPSQSPGAPQAPGYPGPISPTSTTVTGPGGPKDGTNIGYDPNNPGDPNPQIPVEPPYDFPEPHFPEPQFPEPHVPGPEFPGPDFPGPDNPDFPTHPTPSGPGWEDTTWPGPDDSSTVGGTPQSGVDPTRTPTSPTSPPGSTVGGPTSPTGGPSSAIAAGAGAGASAAGIRAGAIGTTPASNSARPIGSGGRTGGPGAIARGAAVGSPVSRAGGAAPGGAARSAGGAARAAGGASRAAGPGARGAVGAAGTRATGAAGAAGRGGATGRGGAAAGAGAGAGRSGRGKDDKAEERDSLVMAEDWLGDEDVSPEVLD